MNSINLSYMNKHDNPNSDTKKEKIDDMDIWPWRDFWFLMHHLRTTSADLLFFFTTSAKEEAEWKWVCPLIFFAIGFYIRDCWSHHCYYYFACARDESWLGTDLARKSDQVLTLDVLGGFGWCVCNEKYYDNSGIGDLKIRASALIIMAEYVYNYSNARRQNSKEKLPVVLTRSLFIYTISK